MQVEQIKAKFFKVVDPLADFCVKRKWIRYLLVAASVLMLAVVGPMLTPEIPEWQRKKTAAAAAKEVFLEREPAVATQPHWVIGDRNFRWCEPRGTTVVCGSIGLGGEKVNEAIFMTPPKELYKTQYQ